jgi:hypothetical protein
MPDDDEFDPEDYEGVSERLAQLPRREVRRFERDRRERDALKAQNLELNRRLAFSDAGIKSDDPAAKYFIKAYEGDMDPEAIRVAAIEARVITAGNAGTISTAEAAGHQFMGAAANGGSLVSQEDEVSRQLAEAAKIHWRNADQAVPEIMRIVKENEIRLHVPG